VILSWIAGRGYTMAWDIAAYRTAGIPFVDREAAGEPAADRVATQEEAFQRGLRVAETIGCDFVYWCANLLVAVDGFAEGDSGAAAPDVAARVATLIEGATRPAAVDEPLHGPDKRAIHAALAGVLRPELLEAMVFVLEGDEQEVELCRDLVGAEDVPGLISAYWRLPTWQQRVLVILLLTDRDEPILQPLWLDVLAAPDDGPETARHGAKAIALARLDGDMTGFDRYLGDHALVVREAARRTRRAG
jgi:hypothetical protein